MLEFEYVGGGYFRDKTVPKGKTAETLHGMQIIEHYEKIIEELRNRHAEQLSTLNSQLKQNVEALEQSQNIVP